MFSFFLGYLIRTHYTSMFDFIVFSQIVWPITVLTLLTNNRSIGTRVWFYEVVFSPFTDISIITTIWLRTINRLISVSWGYFQSYSATHFATISTTTWMLTAVPMENMESNVVSHRLLNKFFLGKSLHFNLEESQKKFMESVSKIHCSNTSDVYGLSIERVSQIKLTFYPIFFGNFTFFLFLTPSPHQNSI